MTKACPVVIHRELGESAPQSGGLNRLVVFLVGRLRDTTLVKDHLSSGKRVFSAYLRKESGELVIILLTPFLKRMVGTSAPDAGSRNSWETPSSWF